MHDLSLSLALIRPELALAIGLMVLLVIGVFRGDQSARGTSWGVFALLLLAAVLVLIAPREEARPFGGALVIDGFAVYAKVLVLIGSSAAVAISMEFLRLERLERFEYPILMGLAALGMMLMISANDFMSLYVALELQSLALYVLAAFNRDSLRASEAGLKYFVLGALSSGLLLYGISLVYGTTGTTGFDGIASVLATTEVSAGTLVGLAFIVAGLAFKVSAVPFHMWTPDVYEGAPTPVTAFFAAAPKVAAMALFVRAMFGPFGAITAEWTQIIILLSILSMALGAFAAIGQTNIKRLMAYSGIGHVGYALVGLAAGTPEGVRGVLIYMTIYLATNLGVFVCILSMRRKEGIVERIEDLSGLSRTQPVLAFTLAILMFSLAGIPPLAGFFGKFFVFLAAVKAGLVWLAVVALVLSVVGSYYYLRIVKVMYFDEPAPAFVQQMPGEMKTVLALSGGFTLFFVLIAGPLIVQSGIAARALFGG